MKKYLLFLLILIYPTAIVFSDQATYEGVKRCRTCHLGSKRGMVYEKWEESRHAIAFKILSKEEKKNPVCLKCHTTGYNEPASPGIKPDNLLGVQCEACHGPGSLYKKVVMDDESYENDFDSQRKKAIEAGLVMPTEETCRRCHNKESPHYKPFIYRMAYPKIKHFLPSRYLAQ